MDNPFLMYLVTATIFTLMFALGVNHSFQQVTSLWREPQLLFHSLLSVIVLVPAAVVLLLWAFDLPPAVAAGLAVLAAAPGAPMTYKRTQMAGGDPTYAASLQLTLALLAVAVTPCILAVFYTLFELPTERVSHFKVALQVGEVTFVPVIIGLLIRHFAPALAERIATPVRKLANGLFAFMGLVIVILLAVSPQLRAMFMIGGLPKAAIISMVGVSLVIGHLLGGPSQGKRSVLAVASIARNVGLALFIAGLSDYDQQIIPTILAYMLIGSILAIPYNIWSKHQTTQRESS